VSVGILFVCTGNICRSPMAERMLLARLPTGSPVAVASAGTRALAGYGMDANAARVLTEFGGNPAGHVAGRLSAQRVQAADLVLTAASLHRSEVLAVEPMALRRTFTMREFARLAAALPAPDGPPTDERLRARVADAAAQRGSADPVAPGGDEIADPYGAPLAVMRTCGRQISDVVDEILRGLGLAAA
jgi:protein-tyrosine phosphatase